MKDIIEGNNNKDGKSVEHIKAVAKVSIDHR